LNERTPSSYSRLLTRLLIQAGLLLAGLNAAASAGLTWPLIKKAVRVQYSSVPQLSTTDLSTWLATPDTTMPILLDVREKKEYQVSQLKDAMCTPDLDQALKNLADAPLDTPIVAYCSVGYRSSKLIEQLQEAGYTRVFNLEGSLFEWANQGRPIYRDTTRVQKVHPYDSNWSRLLKRELRLEEE
jgi:rhodanese-related sulfurtransferase